MKQSFSHVRIERPVFSSANELGAQALAWADESARSIIEGECLRGTVKRGAHKGKSGSDLSRVGEGGEVGVAESLEYLAGRMENTSSVPRPAFDMVFAGDVVLFVDKSS